MKDAKTFEFFNTNIVKGFLIVPRPISLQVILFVLAVVAFADDTVEVVDQSSTGPEGPVYRYHFTLDNDVHVEESGSEGSAGQSVAQGSYRSVNGYFC